MLTQLILLLFVYFCFVCGMIPLFTPGDVSKCLRPIMNHTPHYSTLPFPFFQNTQYMPLADAPKYPRLSRCNIDS